MQGVSKRPPQGGNTMKLTQLKTIALRIVATAALAGAALAVTPAAQAQRVFVGIGGPHVIVGPPVRFYGGPVYYGHPYYGRPFYGHEHFAPRPYWHR
jgi:hypothetical protein